MQLVAFAEMLLLSVWLGSMIFFSFAVAPSAFAVLPTRELAGALVTSTIGKVEALGLIIGPLLIVIKAARWRAGRHSPARRMFQILLLVLMIAAAGLSRFWVSAQMVSLRARMGGRIDDLPVADPLRVQFNDLHQYSVGLMSAAIVAGLLMLFLTIRSYVKR